MKWGDFLNQILEENQVKVLRCALKLQVSVKHSLVTCSFPFTNLLVNCCFKP